MGRSLAEAYDPSVADYRATSPSEWGGVAFQTERLLRARQVTA
jgi:hypothetical protein